MHAHPSAPAHMHAHARARDRYVPHGLYVEHYRTSPPLPVRSIVPKVPLLCVYAPSAHAARWPYS